MVERWRSNGTCGISKSSFGLLGEGVAEIGIKICDFSYQNKGYGNELLHMLITYLFEDGDLNEKYRVDKIILDTNLKNVRAQHVYEKLGFTSGADSYEVILLKEI